MFFLSKRSSSNFLRGCIVVDQRQNNFAGQTIFPFCFSYVHCAQSLCV